MDVKNFYNTIEGDYDATIGRLGSENLIARLLIKFKDDPSMAQLISGMESGNCDDAFRGAHTLKGLALNLGFTKLAESSSALTEVLRAGSFVGSEELYITVKECYDKIIDAVNAAE